MTLWTIASLAILLGIALALLGIKVRRSARMHEMFFPGLQTGKKSSKKEQELAKRLLGLVHGREDVARRLVELEQSRNPEKSRKWCLNKAIESLKRERR
ncbi:hypothetical protein Dthio_PD0820 [Desulfonatronospira thiodismutans ASO3-1]|uniref:Uncharacterized protein n=1 Tax=Desulfonatronospira thiodismutans ASO3-1 TaxID=555779 RepID=D6SS20_9BACT|nr:hypothetical protein [Desulfonatronospira thiodismutans]EFI33486.1 hypothetical protein Dthio_PD0820 [Desulfonatronospira thiodismutans ASO3-1]